MHNNNFKYSRVLTVLALSLAALWMSVQARADGAPKGLNLKAGKELRAAGVDKYLGQFTPSASSDVGDGWTQHTFDTEEGDGPICIAGAPYSVYTRPGDPEKLLIFLQGAGACWQDSYYCYVLSGAQPQPTAGGIWDFANPENPFADYSIVYMPSCDGSTFVGDNDVVDANFPYGPIRFHRGLRNLSAGMDVARAEFKRPEKIVVAGSSGGGVGAAAFAPFLARLTYGNTKELFVFNDAGSIAVNWENLGAIVTRAVDWQFAQFYPESCAACDPFGQPSAIIDWRLENDATVRDSLYETDGNATNRFFTNIASQLMYRALILEEHGALHDAYPTRYKRFIVSGDDSHTALQSFSFYTQDANGILLIDWTRDFVDHAGQESTWVDIVEDFLPLP